MNIKTVILFVLKGMSMGAANVIPGVSGGTMALITGIFERLINAIKSFNLTAVKLLFSGKFLQFIKHIDIYFLLAVFFGIGLAMISIAKLFEHAFEENPILIWAFFFGLVLSSVLFLAKEISKWNITTILFFFIGTAAAVSISILSPASENSTIYYLFICGVLAACSMILPGLSGSFILILLGNYQLVMIDAVSNFKIDILAPVIIGGLAGLLAFSHLLSWVFKNFRNATIATLTGFVMGSLGILWPWKNHIYEEIGGDQKILVSYEWFLPNIDKEFFMALIIFIFGVISIWIIERIGNKLKERKK